MKEIPAIRIIITLGLSVILLCCTSRHMKYEVPERFKTQISQADYNHIVEESEAAIVQICKVKKVEDGAIYVDSGIIQGVWGLDNLILQCIKTDKMSEREVLIKEYFETIRNIEKEKVLQSGKFENIKPYLSLRIYPDEYLNDSVRRNILIYKVDLPGTVTALALDLPSSFQSVNPDTAAKWHMSAEDLFQIAQQNINSNVVEKHRQDFESESGKKMEVNLIENQYYAGTYALDIEHNCPAFLGKFGAIVAIPNRGFVIVCKIEDQRSQDLIAYIQKSSKFVDKANSSEPGPVSGNFFWCYKGKFTLIKTGVDIGGTLHVTIPQKLRQLIDRT